MSTIRPVSKTKMQAENMTKSRLDFEKFYGKYNALLSHFEKLAKDNIREAMETPSAELETFMGEVNKLPDDESKTLKEAILAKDYKAVGIILQSYVDRYLRLKKIDRRYSCKALFQQMVHDDARIPIEARHYLALGEETSKAIKDKVYHYMVHENDKECDRLFETTNLRNRTAKCNTSVVDKEKLVQCLQRRICGHALLYNNIPENFDDGHLYAALKYDCDDSINANYNQDRALRMSIDVDRKREALISKLEDCKGQSRYKDTGAGTGTGTDRKRRRS